MKPATSAIAGLMMLAVALPAIAQVGPREYPVRTPPPAHTVPEFTRPIPPGAVILQPNMPGHRRFRNPLWPNAGWDSPTLENGQKHYEHYLIQYWRAPTVAEGTPDADHPGRAQRGYVNRTPDVRVARSRATPQQEALFERRARLILHEVMATAPLRNLHGASLEPQITITGYGEEHGAQGDGVMRGEIRLHLRLLKPYTGSAERQPDGSVRSTADGPSLRIILNPTHLSCVDPVQRTAHGVYCPMDGDRVAGDLGSMLRPTESSGRDALAINTARYADGRDATAIRVAHITVDYNRGVDRANMPRGRMHPHDALGRAIGVSALVDWNDLLTRANAVE